MKKFIASLLLFSQLVHAAGETRIKNGVISTGSMSVGTSSAADSKSVLDVVSTTKGFLPPRMTTTQRDNISSPTTGLEIYNTTTNKKNRYNGSAWVEIADTSTSQTFTNKTLTAPVISTISNSGTLTLPTSTDTLVGRATTDTLTNKTLTSPTLTTPVVDDGADFNEEGSISSPAAGKRRVAIKSDGKMYIRDSSGNETAVGTGSGGIPSQQLANPDWESNTNNWTASGGTYTRTTTAANIMGAGAGSWDSSSASQTLTSDAATITAGDGLSSQDAVVSCRFKAGSGTATHKIQLYDGTNVLSETTISSSTAGFVRTTINGVFPASGTAALRIISVASDEPTLYIDDCYMGLAANFNAFLSQVTTPWTDYTLTIGATTSAPTPGTTTVNHARWRRVGDSMEIAYDLVVTAAGTAGTGSYLFPLPAGYTINTSKQRVSTTAHEAQVGTGCAWQTFGNNKLCTIHAYNSTNLTLEYQDGTTSAFSVWGSGLADFSNSTTYRTSWTARVPITGWSAEQVFRPEVYNWKVDANISGANPDLGGSDVTAYAGIENGSLTLTNNSGSGNITAQIPCSSTNPPTGTTCAAGNESLGVSFTIPAAQDVIACASFSQEYNSTGGTGINTVFQIVETPNNAQTISQEGKSRIKSGTNNANLLMGVPLRVCGNFSFSSAGQKTLRLFYEQDIVGSITSNIVLGDADATQGQRDIHWEVYPITQQVPAPVLVGSVTSRSTGAERVERAVVTGSTGAIVTQSGSWLSCGSPSGGAHTCTISPAFSAAPTCVISSNYAADNWVIRITGAPTASGFTTQGWKTADGSAANVDFAVICMGPR